MTEHPEQPAELPAGPRAGDRHVTFFEDPIKDHLLRAVITLAGELSVTRERLDSLEAVLAEQGALDRGLLNQRLPDAAMAQAREATRQKLLAALLTPLVADLSRKP